MAFSFSEKKLIYLQFYNIANESIELGKNTLNPEAEQKLLGVIIDKDLSFQSHKKFLSEQHRL